LKFPRYNNVLSTDTLFKDKHVIKWVKWIRDNEFLGMGIPSTTTDQMGIRVIYGNPFDQTITIMKNGQCVVEPTPMAVCALCDKSHSGMCLKAVSTLKGKWFFSLKN